MKKSNQGKRKTPKNPSGKRRWLPKTLLLEILFFVALGVFGFAIVATLLGDKEEAPVARFVENTSTGELVSGQAALLYEAPSPRPLPEMLLAPIFTPSVQYWEEDIVRWAIDNGIDPDLAATVMQIESCGAPEVGSHAGAQGLFQVMPFHFEEDEDPHDPETNALRGMAYLARGLEVSGGHAGLAMAGYNGGHGLITRSYDSWPRETQRYYRWGSGIYREAAAGWDHSPTLNSWLEAGGASLCEQAEEALNLQAAR